MNPADYRLLVSTVTDDHGALTQEDIAARVVATKAELALVRKMLREDWGGFPKGCQAVSLTIIWSDKCDLKPRVGRRDRDGVLPVRIAAPAEALVRSLRDGQCGSLLRWLILSTLIAVVGRARSGEAPAALVSALSDSHDYSRYLTAAGDSA